MMHALGKQIRHWGNAALADRYQAAYANALRARKEQARLIALGLERRFTDVERAQVDAADVTADDEKRQQPRESIRRSTLWSENAAADPVSEPGYGQRALPYARWPQHRPSNTAGP
jgi:hypothetical protein